MSTMPLVPELKDSYDRMLIYLEKLFRSRFKKIREVVYKLHSGMNSEKLVQGYLLSNDETIKNIGMAKYQEILEDTLAAEREAYIERLAHEITILNEKILVNEKQNEDTENFKISELEKSNNKLRLQITNFKKTIEEMKELNEKTLAELEFKSNKIKQLESEVTVKFSKPIVSNENIETLRKENSLLANQLRDIQDELVENSNISKAYSKNATQLEASNQLLSERCAFLERENREYEEKITYLNESQERLNLQGITKLKNKLTKLKDTLDVRNNKCVEFENEIFRANQIIEEKDRELSTIFMQYNELKNSYDSHIQTKENEFLNQIKGIFLMF